MPTILTGSYNEPGNFAESKISIPPDNLKYALDLDMK